MPSSSTRLSIRFFSRLQKESNSSSLNAFAKATNKKAANLSSYLHGRSVAGPKAMTSAARYLFEWQVSPVLEVMPLDIDSLPQAGGIYILYDSAGQVVYIGKATNLRNEVRQTLARALTFPVRFGPGLKKTRPTFRSLTSRISAYTIPTPRVRHNIEALLQRIFANQLHNANVGGFQE